MKKFWEHLFGFDHESSKGEVLYFKLFELFIIGYVIYFAWDWGIYIQQIGEVVLPLGIAQYIDVSFMFDNSISLINAALMTVFSLMGFFRIFPRGSYAIAMALFHLHYVSRYSLGEISHGSNFIGMSLLGLALGLFFFQDPKIYRRFVLGFLFFFFGLGYTSAGISKLIGTGITWPDGRHIWLWITERHVDVLSKSGQFSFNWLQQMAMEYRWVGTASLLFGLLAELFGFLLWFRKTRPFIATALIGMHFGVYLSMNIMFDMYIYELLILGYPWVRWMNRHINFDETPVFARFYGWSLKFA